MQIGLVVPMIAGLPLVIAFLLILILCHSLARNNPPWHDPVRRRNIVPQHALLPRSLGSVPSSMNSKSPPGIPVFFIVTMLVLLVLLPTQCFMLAQNTLKQITISFVISSLPVLLKCNLFVLTTRLQISSQRDQLPHVSLYFATN